MLDANVESDIKLKDFNTYKQHSMAELWERNNGMEKETSEIYRSHECSLFAYTY